MDKPLINPTAGIGVASVVVMLPPIAKSSQINPMAYIPTPGEMSPQERRETFRMVGK